MIRSALDHLVVVAPTLAEGAAVLESELGVGPVRGGQHPRMGTHNLLLRIGATAYLEVIAVDPAAPHPGRPRWFELDRIVPGEQARFATWVARTSDLMSATAASPVPLGRIETMTRGDLEWAMTIPPGGHLLEGGVVPTLIQWARGSHPAGRLPDVGVSLERLDLVHPTPDIVTGVLQWIGFEGIVSVVAGDRPSLEAHLRTPGGARTLHS